jgi:uncharacterized protein (DUF2267 family)
MSSSGLEVFDKTLQTTHVWLGRLMEDEAFGPDRQLAWHALGAVLRAIRDRLPVELAAHLGSQLPLLIRGTYYDQFTPARQPVRERTLEEFLAGIGDQLEMGRPINLRRAARAVFEVLSENVNQGQIEKVRESLPEEVRNLWPEVGDIRPETRQASGRAPTA